MRIYKSDGSYLDNPEDTEFGWSFNEIIVDEAVPSYQERNRDRVTFSALRKSVAKPQKHTISESVDVIPEEPKGVVIQEHYPNVKVYSAKTSIKPEGLNPSDSKKYENIDAKVPSKQKVASLITPCSVESKMLLSVVHYAKYRHLMGDKEVVNLGDLRSSSRIKFLINDRNTDNLEEELKDEIRNYRETEEDSMLSLMMELILADMKCDVSDVSNCSKGVQNGDSSGLGNSIRSSENSSNEDAEGGCSLVRFELGDTRGDINRSDVLSSIGLSDAVDKSIEQMCEETYDIHLKIAEIRKSFQEDEIRVNALIEEAQGLKKSLRETKYLDDLLHLLNGQLDEVAPKKWPFRIFLPSSDWGKDDINLIV